MQLDVQSHKTLSESLDAINLLYPVLGAEVALLLYRDVVNAKNLPESERPDYS